jgi:hypothetical protein
VAARVSRQTLTFALEKQSSWTDGRTMNLPVDSERAILQILDVV